MTKKQLLEFIQGLPVGDDCLVNVSLNQEDICIVHEVQVSYYPDEETPATAAEFCLDFTVS